MFVNTAPFVCKRCSVFAQEPWELAAYAADIRNYVGRTQWWDGSYAADNVDFSGLIDDFSIFDIALADDEVQNIDLYTSIDAIVEDDAPQYIVDKSVDTGIYDIFGHKVDESALKKGHIYISRNKKWLQQ